MSAYLQPSFEGLGRFDKVKQVSDEDGFGHWLAGYTAAEGWFSAGVRSRSAVIYCTFGISSRIDNAKIIEEIHAKLGVGNISSWVTRSNNSKPLIAFRASRRTELELLVLLFEKYPLRAKKSQVFEVWASLVRYMRAGKHKTEHGHQRALALVDEVKRKLEFLPSTKEIKEEAELDDAFGYWLSGFIDGDGSFNIKYSRGCKSFGCMLDIQLRGDDRPILETIQKTLGVGYVYDRTRPSDSGNLIVGWRVSKTADLFNIIVPLLKRYPMRTKKQRDFETWAQAVSVLYLKGMRHYTWERKELWRLKKELQEGRRYKGSP